MAEEASEVPQPIVGGGPEPAQGMELETGSAENPADSGAGDQPNGTEKRGREEVGNVAAAAEEEDGENGAAKKQKVETSVEEERLEKQEEKKEGVVESMEEEDGEGKGNVSLGPKVFGSSVAMFDYFYKFLHFWPPNLDINKYEYMVLLDLLKKGHAEADKKIGEGIQAFQVRYHPMWKSRCFFLVRVDGSSDDFSFRKCVDHILPLPENMKAPSGSNEIKAFHGKKGGGYGGSGGRGGRGGGRRGGGGRGRGRRTWK